MGSGMRRQTTTRRAIASLAALAAAGAAATACGAADGPGATPPSATSAPDPVAATKVLVIVEENHTYDQMREGMPYLASLSERYGYATSWSAITHPSEPNYLAMFGGSTFGILDDQAPEANVGDVGEALSVFDQALAHGKTARTYAESMPQSCHVYDDPDKAVGVPKYAVRHNPWVYFTSGREDCLQHDVSTETFAVDASADDLPNVGLLVPNLDNDAHDGSLATADAWLEATLQPVLSSDDFLSGRLVVVVTADEDDRSGDNTVLTSVLTPALDGVVVDTPLTHYSLTRFIADVLGVEPLGEGSDAPDMAAAFGL